jgi:hypothetical protein
MYIEIGRSRSMASRSTIAVAFPSPTMGAAIECGQSVER